MLRMFFHYSKDNTGTLKIAGIKKNSILVGLKLEYWKEIYPGMKIKAVMVML